MEIRERKKEWESGRERQKKRVMTTSTLEQGEKEDRHRGVIKE